MEIAVEQIKITGSTAEKGKEAPSGQVNTLDGGVDVVGSSRERAQLIITFPSLSEEVYAARAVKFKQALGAFTTLYGRIVTTEDIEVARKFAEQNDIQPLEVVQDASGRFGSRFGVLIAEGPLADKFAQGAFVIDRDGDFTYTQVLTDINQEPDYEAAAAAVKAAAVSHKEGCSTEESCSTH